MTELRKGKREGRHPLEGSAKLRPSGPALDRRSHQRARLTVQLPLDVVDRLRNAVYWTKGTTITGLIESCIMATIDQMEADRGEAFPERAEPLRAGRPPK